MAPGGTVCDIDSQIVYTPPLVADYADGTEKELRNLETAARSRQGWDDLRRAEAQSAEQASVNRCARCRKPVATRQNGLCPRCARRIALK